MWGRLFSLRLSAMCLWHCPASAYGGAWILAKEPRSQRANIVFFCELLVFLSQKPTVLRCREVKNANYALQLFAEICLDSGIDGGESGRSRCPLLSVFSCAVCVCIRFLSTFRVVAVRQIFLRIWKWGLDTSLWDSPNSSFRQPLPWLRLPLSLAWHSLEQACSALFPENKIIGLLRWKHP